MLDIELSSLGDARVLASFVPLQVSRDYLVAARTGDADVQSVF